MSPQVRLRRQSHLQLFKILTGEFIHVRDNLCNFYTDVRYGLW